MKTAVKTPARKTNNQVCFGGSLLKNNMGDGTWTKPVCNEFAPFMLEGDLGSHHLCLRVFWVYTLFNCGVPGSDEVCFWEQVYQK